MSTREEGGASPDTLLYQGGGFRVGAFRRTPEQRPFEDTGPIQGFLLVFPRTSVVIQHEGRAPVVADPTRVMLYNRGQVYRRRALSARGDACEWFSFPAGLMADALRPADPSVDDRPDRPFTATHAPADAATYVLQRRVVEHLQSCARRGAAVDALFVEEAMVRLLGRAADAATAGSPDRPASIRGDHRALCDACRAHLAAHLGAPLSLTRLARDLGVSPFHLARVFRRETGTTVHATRHALRLRTSLERITAGDDLARVAVELGYASHSHFTFAFRRMFGVTPTSFRART